MIPNTVTELCEYAFKEGTSLKSVTLGSSVSIIGNAVFRDCSSLEDINVVAGNPTYASDGGVLYNGDKTSLILCPQAKSSVTIPNSVTTIGEEAFYSCIELQNVTIPNSVTALGWGAFACCANLKSVTIGDGIVEIPSQAFNRCTLLETVNFGGSVKKISNGAFGECGLKSVALPNSLAEIGQMAFSGCKSLKSVDFGDSLTTIDWLVFIDCESLESVDLPASLTYIGGEVFIRCHSLTAINVAEGNSTYTSVNGVLCSKDKTKLVLCPNGLEELSVPDGVTEIDGYVASFSALKSVTLPNSVTKIAYNAFYSCESLSSVTLGNSVASIGARSFGNCTSLESIHLPASLTDIDPTAFAGCNNLKDITVEDGNPNYSTDGVGLYSADGTTLLSAPGASSEFVMPNAVTTIGASALSGNSSLTSVVIPNSVTTIEAEAFSYCTALESVTIGNVVPQNESFGMLRVNVQSESGLTSIGDRAFYGCENLTAVNCMASTPPVCSESAWPDEAYQNATLYVPNGCGNAYRMAEGWSGFLNVVDDGTTEIESIEDHDAVEVMVNNGVLTVNGIDPAGIIEVYDMAGRQVYRGVATTVEGLASGIYVVRVAGKSIKVAL